MPTDRDPKTKPGLKAPKDERSDVVVGEGGLPAGGGCVPEQLHVCFHCSGELAYPLDWSEEGPGHWRIVLRCPECESRRDGVFEQGLVERLDDELDRGASALLGDLRRLTHANMSEEIDFFVRVLAADVITPSDF
ncbi:MAG: hypothetical protein ABSG95_10485 [Solirubrobacteraceae bacterium]|jgi:hypothetical protein